MEKFNPELYSEACVKYGFLDYQKVQWVPEKLVFHDEFQTKKEHLLLKCPNCGFRWERLPLDATEGGEE